MSAEKATNPIVAIYSEALEKSARTARYDLDALVQAGFADPVKHGRGGLRQFTTWGTANYIILGISGLPIKDCAQTIPTIRALPLVPARSDFKLMDVFEWFSFPKARTVGGAIEALIDDHRRGYFDTFREG